MYLRDRVPVSFTHTATFDADLPNNVNLLDRLKSKLTEEFVFYDSSYHRSKLFNLRLKNCASFESIF